MTGKRTPEQLASWRERAVERMTASREATLKFLAKLPEEEILRPASQGLWSINDVLAHIAAWEEDGVHRLELISRGRGDRLKFYDDMREANEFNAQAVKAASYLSPAAMIRRLARIRTRLVERLRTLPPESLHDRSHRYPVTVWLPEFCWTHERDHLRRMRRWWAESRPGRSSRRPVRPRPADE